LAFALTCEHKVGCLPLASRPFYITLITDVLTEKNNENRICDVSFKVQYANRWI